MLTTAYCVDGSSASSLAIRIGSADRTSGGSIIGVSKVIVHPSYTSSTMDNDYAILHLSENALDTPGVTSTSLPSTDAGTANNLPLRVAGWGKQASSESTLQTTLRQANMLSVDRTTCHGLWEDVNAITKNMICFQPDDLLDPGASACNGDTGGPVVDGLGETVYGLVSWQSKDCSASPRPNVGSNVGEETAKSWINGLTI